MPQNKPAIVLLHGFRGSPVGLREIADVLEQHGYQTYSPAVPPFAGATALSEWSYQAYARYVADYLKRTNIVKPVLVGHSMGSVVAASVAQHFPELIDSRLILLSPLSTRPAKPFAAISPFSGLLPRRAVDYCTTRFLFVPHDRKLFKRVLALTDQCSGDHPPRRTDAMASAKFAAQASVEDFNLDRQTVLLLAGAKDRLIPTKATRALGQRLGASVEFLPGSGHLHNYEQPIATAEAILRFLDQH